MRMDKDGSEINQPKHILSLGYFNVLTTNILCLDPSAFRCDAERIISQYIRKDDELLKYVIKELLNEMKEQKEYNTSG